MKFKPSILTSKIAGDILGLLLAKVFKDYEAVISSTFVYIYEIP